MKIIVAGYPQTGTKTLITALKTLGYTVYDFPEHFFYHGRDWNKIFNGEGSPDDFKRMYDDVDVVADSPAFYFWEEIAEVFPEAKIILTVCDENLWYRKFKTHSEKYRNNFSFSTFQTILPTGQKIFKMMQKMNCAIFGVNSTSRLNVKTPNELLHRMKFRQHQTYCLQNAPEERLLMYDVKKGWNPLCEFLDKDVPDDVPFPRKPITERKMKEVAANHPLNVKMMHEVKVILACFNVFILLIAFSFNFYVNL